MTPTSDAEVVLRVAQVVPFTGAEGPGVRFALWFQGCPLRCPGCCNPEMLPFAGGAPLTVGEVLSQVEAAARDHGVEGATLMGGEPLAHAAGAAALGRGLRQRGLSLMVFTGFTLEEARDPSSVAEPSRALLGDPAVAELIGLCDILVDGPYVREQPDTTRRWVGSTNQRIHFLTDRYHFDDRWRKSNTLEIRLHAGELTVNGFPAKAAAGLWKRPRVRRPLPLAGEGAAEAGDQSKGPPAASMGV